MYQMSHFLKFRRPTAFRFAVLIEAGMDPSRNDQHGYTLYDPNLLSLANRTPYNAIPSIDPWDLGDYDNHIFISPTLAGVTKKNTPPATLKRKAETEIIKLGPFDHAFWTDGSYDPTTKHSSGACIAYETLQSALHHTDTPPTSYCEATGMVGASYTPEAKAINHPNYIISSNPIKYRNTTSFVGTDSQSSLTGYNPLKLPKFGKARILLTRDANVCNLRQFSSENYGVKITL